MTGHVKTVNHQRIQVEEVSLDIHTTATRKTIETHLHKFLEVEDDNFRPVKFKEYLRMKGIEITYIYTKNRRI
jgi:Fe-S cluster biosynthesis and repair protein YggX